MNKQEVLITIDPKTQEVSYEVKGVMGGKCTDITQALTKGNKVKEQQFTEEYLKRNEMPVYNGE